MTSGNADDMIRLDLNNPVFQQALFSLTKNDQRATLNTLKKMAGMTWRQVYSDRGLKWEAILSRKGPKGARIYTFRLGKGFRAIGYRDNSWLRILSLHPEHNSAYK